MHTHTRTQNQSIVANSSIGAGHYNLQLKVPSARYANEFTQLTCAPDLLLMEVFPNFKEITESMSMHQAVRKHIPIRPSEPATVIVVGDGSTPRTGALFAFRSTWEIYSVDPNMRYKEKWEHIKRLTTLAHKIQNCTHEIPIKNQPIILLFPHSHVGIEETLLAFNFDEELYDNLFIIAMPCCQELEIHNHKPTHEYSDWGNWSPERLIRIWMNIPPSL